jgi:fucose permease
MAAGLVSLTILENRAIGRWGPFLAVGSFNSVMFPTIVSLALENLGEHTGRGSGILCMAIAGGGVTLYKGYLRIKLEFKRHLSCLYAVIFIFCIMVFLSASKSQPTALVDILPDLKVRRC